MHTPERPNADQFLARLRDDFANLAETLGAGTWDPPALRERLEQIRVARESALLNGFSGLAETISEIADACEACSEPEALHPSSVSVVVDAITGAETVVEAMSPKWCECDASTCIAYNPWIVCDASGPALASHRISDDRHR